MLSIAVRELVPLKPARISAPYIYIVRPRDANSVNDDRNNASSHAVHTSILSGVNDGAKGRPI